MKTYIKLIVLGCMFMLTATSAKTDSAHPSNPASYIIKGKKYHVLRSNHGYHRVGTASWYGPHFHKHLTANGEIYNMYAMTAAHKTLPLPTTVQVTNLANHKKVIVKINDRGPFHGHREIDLSYAAAKELGILKPGTGKVDIKTLDLVNKKNARPTKPQKPLDYYIQVAAYSKNEPARTLAKKLTKSLKQEVRVETVTEKKHIKHRVKVGPIGKTATAEKIRGELKQLGYHQTSLLVQ